MWDTFFVVLAFLTTSLLFVYAALAVWPGAMTGLLIALAILLVLTRRPDAWVDPS